MPLHQPEASRSVEVSQLSKHHSQSYYGNMVMKIPGIDYICGQVFHTLH